MLTLEKLAKELNVTKVDEIIAGRITDPHEVTGRAEQVEEPQGIWDITTQGGTSFSPGASWTTDIESKEREGGWQV